MAFLAAETFYFCDGHAGNASGCEPLLNFVKLKGLDNCLNFFHGISPSIKVWGAAALLARAAAVKVTRLDIEIERELPRMGPQPNGIDLILALVLQPGLDHVLGKHIAAQQE